MISDDRLPELIALYTDPHALVVKLSNALAKIDHNSLGECLRVLIFIIELTESVRRYAICGIALRKVCFVYPGTCTSL